MDGRVGFVGFIDNFLKPVVGNNIQPIYRSHTGSNSVRQAQSASNGLLNQNPRIGGAEGDNRIKIIHVPPFLEHIDMDHDLRRLGGVFHLEQFADHDFFQSACLAGIDLKHAVFIAANKKPRPKDVVLPDGPPEGAASPAPREGWATHVVPVFCLLAKLELLLSFLLLLLIFYILPYHFFIQANRSDTIPLRPEMIPPIPSASQVFEHV